MNVSRAAAVAFVALALCVNHFSAHAQNQLKKPEPLCESPLRRDDSPRVWKESAEARRSYDAAMQSGRYAEAETLAKAMLADWVKSCPPLGITGFDSKGMRSFDYLAEIAAFLIKALEKQNRQADARKVPEEIVRAYEAAYGTTHKYYRYALERAANLALKIDPPSALGFALRGLELVRKNNGTELQVYEALRFVVLIENGLRPQIRLSNPNNPNPPGLAELVRTTLGHAAEGCRLGAKLRARVVLQSSFEGLKDAVGGVLFSSGGGQRDLPCATSIDLVWETFFYPDIKLTAAELASAQDAAFAALQIELPGTAGDGLIRLAVMERAKAAGPAAVAAANKWRGALAELQAIDMTNRKFMADVPKGQLFEGEYFRRYQELERQLKAAGTKVRETLTELSAAIGQDIAEVASRPPLTLKQLQSDAVLQSSDAVIIFSGLLQIVVTKEQVVWTQFVGAFDVEREDSVRFFSADEASEFLRDDAESQGRGGGAAPDKATRAQGSAGYEALVSFAFYKSLFGGPQIAQALSGKSHWVIVPDAYYAMVPLAALLTEDPSKPANAKATPAWLGLKKSLSVVPSVRSLAVRPSRTPSRSSNNVFVGVGDPDLAGRAKCKQPDAGAAKPEFKNYYDKGRISAEWLACLPALPGTRGELKQLQKLFKAPDQNVLVGAGATERRIVQHPSLPNANVVAFATHGLVHQDFDQSLAEPALVLTPVSNDETDDGLLMASEVANLPLGNAQLVILSACNTALAGFRNQFADQGLTGLARSFFYAGAQSLVVSHWRVADDAAAFLTTHMAYHRIFGGKPTSEALREAMIELATQRPNNPQQKALGLMEPMAVRNAELPGTWAPFFSVGIE